MTRAGNQKFMGKLRGNMFGSEYLIFDEGENDTAKKKKKGDKSAEGRGELGMVIFPKELIARGGGSFSHFGGLCSSLTFGCCAQDSYLSPRLYLLCLFLLV